MKEQGTKGRSRNQNAQGAAIAPAPTAAKDVARIQKNICMTTHDIGAAEDMAAARTPDSQMNKTLSDKNERRRDALTDMRHELRGEAKAQKEWDEE